MTRKEFAFEFERLAKKFNTQFQARYEGETAQLFYLEIKDLPASWFRFQVNLAIGDMKPVTLSQLRDAAIRKRTEIREEQERTAISQESRKQRRDRKDLQELFKTMNVRSLNEAIAKQKAKNQ